MASMKDTILDFIDRINAHDVDGILGLMADDYTFVNSAGDTFKGRDQMRDVWSDQFHLYPDFRIRVQRVVADTTGVGVFGRSEGTYNPKNRTKVDEENHWEVPAAFFGIAKNGKVVHWQVFSDTSWIFDILEANEEEQGK
jgi:ketosteroid isomerase-like protein